MWYLLIAITGSSVSQRHDIIKMNLTQSNIETGNHFKQVSCISVREYLFVSLKNWKHTIVNWLGPPGAKFDFIVVIIKICLGFLCTGFPGGPVVKDPPASAGDARDTSLILALEDPLEKEMAASPVFLPGKSHGLRSLASYSPWGCKSQTQWSWNPNKSLLLRESV